MKLTPINSNFDVRFTLTNDYWLGEDNHIYEFKDGEFEKLYESTITNYIVVYLNTTRGSRRGIPVHRIIYATMNNVQIQKSDVIHHLDSHKHHNDISNLALISRGKNTSIWFRGKEEVTKAQQDIQLKDVESIEIEKYGIRVSKDGTVRSIKTNKQKKIYATGRSTTNLVIAVWDKELKQQTSVSYPRLLVEAFQDVPTGAWKALAISDEPSELYNPANYYPAQAIK